MIFIINMIRIRIFKATFILLIISLVSLFYSFYWLSVITDNRYYKENERKENLKKFNITLAQMLPVYYKNISDNGINFPEGYLPTCIITSDIAFSAINRTKSDYCKKEIAELHCQKIKPSYKGADTVCPRTLKNICPTTREIHPELSGQYLGTKKS